MKHEDSAGGRTMAAFVDSFGEPTKPSLTVPPDAVSDDSDSDGPASHGHGPRAVENRFLRKIVGARFVSAREVNGWGQSEAAGLLGYSNSTQLSLIERGERLPPLALVCRAAEVYASSVDYLLGVSDDPERDVRQATRGAVLRHVRALIAKNAEIVSEAVIDGLHGDFSTELRATCLISRVGELCSAVDRFRVNAGFDDIRGGAKLLLAVAGARQSLEQASALLDRRERIGELMTTRAKTAITSASHLERQESDGVNHARH